MHFYALPHFGNYTNPYRGSITIRNDQMDQKRATNLQEEEIKDESPLSAEYFAAQRSQSPSCVHFHVKRFWMYANPGVLPNSYVLEMTARSLKRPPPPPPCPFLTTVQCNCPKNTPRSNAIALFANQAKWSPLPFYLIYTVM
ncbi:hypothetical protein NECAME_09163 [Necator americanus]|uniref:Uncharacterized protein n=1 Tax=Necator americanus TaxID=51031 RepID=W2TF29_NECAM|nr:hypothetical protein NECAME_09163 [Necator americanus]ETN80433.1 hypothetical protein NECAME_09163 [Necator americanus]